MIRLIPYLLYLILTGAHVVILAQISSIYSVQINLAALLVLLVAIYKSELAGAWFGFFVGLVLSAGTPGLVGWHALWMTVLAVAAFHARERLNLDSLYAKLLLVLSGVLLHNILVLITTGATDFWYQFLTSAIPGAIYTAVAAWLFFLIKEDRITVKKIKALF